MTPELEPRRKKGRSPFDGRVVAFEDVGIERLREVLAFLFERLAPRHPGILLFDDWHEHDGFVSLARPGDWRELAARLATADSLLATRQEDTAVRVAVHATSFEWLLRYWIDDEAERPSTAACSVDFTCGRGTSSDPLVDEVHALWPEASEVLGARDWFERNYAG